MKSQLKSLFALLAFLFMTSGIQAMTTSDHDCKCPNKETCCVSKEHCATCPSCKDCCKGEKTCFADGEHGKKACKDGDKDCCKKEKGKKGKKGKACSTEGEKSCCKKDGQKKE
jgi:hypothetical protein